MSQNLAFKVKSVEHAARALSWSDVSLTRLQCMKNRYSLGACVWASDHWLVGRRQTPRLTPLLQEGRPFEALISTRPQFIYQWLHDWQAPSEPLFEVAKASLPF